MLGAHLDSWHAATGATDNGAGCAIVMEAIRILKATGLRPRRTVRIALWGGEEQGLVGSYAYVFSHLGGKPEPADEAERSLPPDMQRRTGPLTTKPDWKKLSAYFNVDSGGGKFRGIYCQENVEVKPIFSAWLAPLADLGAATTTLRNDAGSDNLSFDAVGLPSFNFIQDDLDYAASHHTSMDVYERVNELDVQQAAVVMATFVYQTAMRDDLLPRKPAPL
jgi:Zn-dependent M28 family amino/carboxypeptidase